jgi:hypothetical protein
MIATRDAPTADMKRASLTATLGVGLLAAACANSSGSDVGSVAPSTGIAASPRTVTVGGADHTAMLRIGDHLVFNSGEPLPSGAQWVLTSYPQDELTLDSEPGVFPFEFTAVKTGTGSIETAIQPIPGAPGVGQGGLREVAIVVTIED